MKTIINYLIVIAIIAYIVCCFIEFPIITSIIVGIILYNIFMFFAAIYALSHHNEIDAEWVKHYTEELNKKDNKLDELIKSNENCKTDENTQLSITSN